MLLYTLNGVQYYGPVWTRSLDGKIPLFYVITVQGSHLFSFLLSFPFSIELAHPYLKNICLDCLEDT
jgi:hypothetical protein